MVPPIPWAKASSRAKRAVVVANLAIEISRKSVRPAVAGSTYVEPFLETSGAIRGSGPRTLWLRHCKPRDLGCDCASQNLASFAFGSLKS